MRWKTESAVPLVGLSSWMLVIVSNISLLSVIPVFKDAYIFNLFLNTSQLHVFHLRNITLFQCWRKNWLCWTYWDHIVFPYGWCSNQHHNFGYMCFFPLHAASKHNPSSCAHTLTHTYIHVRCNSTVKKYVKLKTG